MASLSQLVHAGRELCVLGIDDTPFVRGDTLVQVAGVVCKNTRFDGLLWGRVQRDGTDATEVLAELVGSSKFGPQLHLVLLDGLTLGGLNVVDLPALHQALGVPCVAVLRRHPDLSAFRAALLRLPDGEQRWERARRAGDFHDAGDQVFQVVGAEPDEVAVALAMLADRGKVPEPLRLAHLIGAGVVNGQSSKRA